LFQKRSLNNQRTCFNREKWIGLINKKKRNVIWYDRAFVYCIIIFVFTTNFSQINSLYCHLDLKSLFCPFPRQNLPSLFYFDIPNNLFNIHSKSSLQSCVPHRSIQMVRWLFVVLTIEHVVGSYMRLKSMKLEISWKHYWWMLC
jgi:hypothetical protein